MSKRAREHAREERASAREVRESMCESEREQARVRERERLVGKEKSACTVNHGGGVCTPVLDKI